MLCLVVFRCCYVTSCKMRHSVGNLDLTGGQGLTKARKSLDFGRKDLGESDVDSTSGFDGEKEDHEMTNLFEGCPAKKTPGEAAE